MRGLLKGGNEHESGIPVVGEAPPATVVRKCSKNENDGKNEQMQSKLGSEEGAIQCKERNGECQVPGGEHPVSGVVGPEQAKAAWRGCCTVFGRSD